MPLAQPIRRPGRPIVTYPPTALVTQNGHQLAIGTTGYFSHDPIERMFTQLGANLPSWLLKA
jgi:hypothetical protein